MNTSHEISPGRIIEGYGYSCHFRVTLMFLSEAQGVLSDRSPIFAHVAIGSSKPHVEVVRLTLGAESHTY